MKPDAMKLAVVIAAYDERENIGPLTQRLAQTLDGMGAVWTLTYIIEGSDGTVDIARRLATERSEIRVFYHPIPSGLGCAFRRGFQAVPPDADMVITMDADLNHQPEELPQLIDCARASGADIVIGSRRVARSRTEGGPLWKIATSMMVGFVMRVLFKITVRDMTSGYRVYRASCLRKIRFQNDDFAFLPEILIHAAAIRAVMVEQPIHFTFRKSGVSKMAIWTTMRSYGRLFSQCMLRRPTRADAGSGPAAVAAAGRNQSKVH